MISEIGNWFSENVEIIMTTLGFTGAGTGALGGVWLFLQGVKTSILNVFDKDTSKLKSEIDLLKEQNQVLLDYVKTSSEIKSTSPHVSDEGKTKLQELSTRANSYLDGKLDSIIDTIKDTVKF